MKTPKKKSNRFYYGSTRDRKKAEKVKKELAKRGKPHTVGSLIGELITKHL